MEEVHLPGDAPAQTNENQVEPEMMDMSPDAKLARIRMIEGELATGKVIDVDLNVITPKTHSPELIAQIHQARRHGERSRIPGL